MFRIPALLLPFVFVVALLAVVAMPRVASAAVNASFAIVGPNPLNATCPVNVNFTGAITGPAGTAVKYTFSHFVNGSSVITAPTSDTIPASGSLAITETLPIDQAHSGFQSNEIDVSSPNAAQGKVFFTVNCVTIVPGNSPSPGAGRLNRGPSGHSYQLIYGIPIPENLKSTTDPHECGQHGGFAGLFCIQAVPDKYLILVWDWQPSDKWPSIDGYHIYDVTGGGKVRAQDQTNQQATVEFFKPGSFEGKCYAVSAYKGTTESVLSPSFCTSGAQVGTRTRNVHMSNWAFSHTEYVSCGFTAGLCVVGTHCDNLCAGWHHHDSGGGPSLDHVNVYWRSYVQFEPSQIVGLNVAKAKLQLRIVGGDPTCFGGIGVAQSQSWGTDQPPNVAWEDVSTSMSATQAVFDVTSIVRDWARGAPNWGFAIRGSNEDTGAEDNGSCLIDFDPNGSLSIEYY